MFQHRNGAMRSFQFVRSGLRAFSTPAPAASSFPKTVDPKFDPNFGNPVFIQVYPGTRSIELKRAKTGNLLSGDVATVIQTAVENFENNDVVSCIFFASRDPDLFSYGLDGVAKSAHALKSVHDMATTITKTKKQTLTMYGGTLTGTAFAAFAGSRYRLGANTVSLRLTELSHGYLPSAGVAHYFANAYVGGTEMARYLAVTGRAVRADELFSMGLISHLVEEEAHDALAVALAHTHASEEESLRDNISRDAVIRVQSIDKLLEMMHIEEDIDVLGHVAWNQYMLVPPGRWDTLEQEDETAAADQTEELRDLDKQIKACFDRKLGVADTRKALGAVGKPWAKEALLRMDALDAGIVEKWWKLTAFASEKGSLLEAVLQKEAELEFGVKGASA